jgi:hypothetical protein
LPLTQQTGPAKIVWFCQHCAAHASLFSSQNG